MRNVVSGVFTMLAVIGARDASAAPPWCAAEGVEKPFGDARVKDAITGKDPRDVLPALVQLTCWPDDEAKPRMREIDAARARWSKAMSLACCR